jgi:hypothetical protein
MTFFPTLESLESQVHFSSTSKGKVGIATPRSEHARDASFRPRVVAIQSPVVNTFVEVLPRGTSSVPPRSVPPRYWFLVRGCTRPSIGRLQNYSGWLQRVQQHVLLRLVLGQYRQNVGQHLTSAVEIGFNRPRLSKGSDNVPGRRQGDGEPHPPVAHESSP